MRAYESSCDQACKRAHDCSSSVVIETCANDCKTNNADIGPHLSTDYLAGLDGCVKTLSCDQLVATQVLQSCQRDAAAKLAPTPAAVTLCDAVVASFKMCLNLTVGTAGCLDSSKIFSDAALTQARGCDKLPCDQRVGCLQNTLGVNPGSNP
jgi:hypothetical protein